MNMNEDLIQALLDPELGSAVFAYERIFELVGEDGRPGFWEERRNGFANIQPTPGKERELLPEEIYLKETITIYTQSDLTAGRGDRKADRVFYRGKAYRVVLVESWREHGGFTKAVAVLEELLPAPAPQDEEDNHEQ